MCTRSFLSLSLSLFSSRACCYPRLLLPSSPSLSPACRWFWGDFSACASHPPASPSSLFFSLRRARCRGALSLRRSPFPLLFLFLFSLCSPIRIHPITCTLSKEVMVLRLATVFLSSRASTHVPFLFSEVLCVWFSFRIACILALGTVLVGTLPRCRCCCDLFVFLLVWCSRVRSPIFVRINFFFLLRLQVIRTFLALRCAARM